MFGHGVKMSLKGVHGLMHNLTINIVMSRLLGSSKLMCLTPCNEGWTQVDANYHVNDAWVNCY